MMKKSNNVTKFYTAVTIFLGIVVLTLMIVGVATRNWIRITTSLSTLETQINQTVTNTTFITSLMNTTNATQTQIEQIVSATERQILQQLTSFGSRDTTYYLYGKDPNVPPTKPKFQTPQGFIFAGIASIFIGLLLAMIVVCSGLPRILRYPPLLFLSVGPILITIGASLYPKFFIEDFGKPLELTIYVGYGLYLVISAAIIAFNAASTFSFIMLQPLLNPSPNTRVRQSVPQSIFRPSYLGRKW